MNHGYTIDTDLVYVIERSAEGRPRVEVEIYAPSESQMLREVKAYENRWSGINNLVFGKPVHYPPSEAGEGGFWAARITRWKPQL